MGQVRALDADIGVNAEMDYTLVGGDGRDVFYITADKVSQNGIISVRKVKPVCCSHLPRMQA